MAGGRPWEVGDETSRWDGYYWPDAYPVLRNKLGIKEQGRLSRAESAISGVEQQLYLNDPLLFGAVYEWAGESRTANMQKGASPFAPHESCRDSVDTLGEVLADLNCLRG